MRGVTGCPFALALALRPTGVDSLSSRWKIPRNSSGANTACPTGVWNHSGTLPTSAPAITTRCPARRSSIAISAPELPAPTSSTIPARSCDGRL